ncbi:BRO family protein [Spirochaeta africana]|uniref:Prophage antirepressor n=1 Tax=Spirochaeta africana (strain ATCC 700263 / DSM 8902 / Z-7692) TaxID=889378 RepID=H9UJG2_SPIAZ|nr:BRO family protein [Spirochaeta africana]AFG37655.1 prophage antirepressor [Spirochaeta africana DSM 8902]
MSQLQVFTNNLFGDVRVIEINGDPWFVAADVARVLGYANLSRDIQRHCKAVREMVSGQGGTESVLSSHGHGGSRKLLIIPERDVYRLIMRSKLPAAERFEEWVVGDVLPQIRKTGEYRPVPRTFGEALRLAADQYDQLEQQRPLVEAAETLLHTPHTKTMSMTDAAKHVGLKPNKEAIAYLKQHGFLTQRMKPSQDAIRMGLLVEKTTFDRHGAPHITAAVPFSALDRWRQYLVPRVHAWRMEGVA